MPDFIPPGLNPLEIPEIVAMVGQQIPLCQRTLLSNPYTGTFTNPVPVTLFAPKDLLACTAVCKAWRRILLPVLWRYYDGALMRHVPLRVLQKASVYFRIFRDPVGQYHQGPFFSTHLQQLVISLQHEWGVSFLDANPALQHLTWTGLGQPLEDQQFMALSRMGQLRDLCLSNCSLVGRSLAMVLVASPGLSRLSLSSVDGITHLDEMTYMMSLEEIALGYLPISSQHAVLDDLTRFCPNLRRISFLGTWGPTNDISDIAGIGSVEGRRQGRDLLKLSSILRVFCPQLESIHFTAAYCFGVDRFNTLQDFELAALAESSARLTSFGADISTLGRMLTDALICHSRTLVAVDLCIRRKYPHQHLHNGGGTGAGGGGEMGFGVGEGGGGLFEVDILDHGIGALAKHSYWDGDEEEHMESWTLSSNCKGPRQSRDIVNAARILTHCSNLRVFRLTSNEKWIRMEEAMALFARPWACLGLEVFSLDHISMPVTPPSPPSSSEKRKRCQRSASSGSGSGSSTTSSVMRGKMKRPTKRNLQGSSPESSVVATPHSMSSSYPSPSPSPSLAPPSGPPSPKMFDMKQAVASTTLTTTTTRSSLDGTKLLLGGEENEWSLFSNGSSFVSPPPISSSSFLDSGQAATSLLCNKVFTGPFPNDDPASTPSPAMSRSTSYSSIPSGSYRSSGSSPSPSSPSSSSGSSSSSSSSSSLPPRPPGTRKAWRRSRSRSTSSSCSSTSSASSASRSSTSSTSTSSSSTASLDDNGKDKDGQGGGDGWKAFGDEFKQRLIPQVTLLTVLRELCLNKVRYARTTIV